MIIIGKQHLSYASTLSNIGQLYKTMAETSMLEESDNNDDNTTNNSNNIDVSNNEDNSINDNKTSAITSTKTAKKKPLTALDRLQLLQRAEEALRDAVAVRTALSGAADKETLSSRIALASVYRLTQKEGEAEVELENVLTIAKECLGKT